MNAPAFGFIPFGLGLRLIPLPTVLQSLHGLLEVVARNPRHVTVNRTIGSVCAA